MNRRCSIEKAVRKNFAIFTGTHPCSSLSFNKNAGLQACNFINKLQHRGFSVNITKFLRTPILQNNVNGCLNVFLYKQIT